MSFLLFLFGAALGSFLNVVSMRYDPEGPIFGKHLTGRSRCPKCGRTLRWFELIPVLSFLFLRGRCRTCGSRLSLQYPLVEIAGGLILVFVPITLYSPLNPEFFILDSVLWIAVFLALLLVAVIDLRLRLIPDELNVLLLVLGISLAFFGGVDTAREMFAGPYGALFGVWENVWLNRLVAAGFAAALFGFLILITKGRGMGMGDLKLATPLAFVFGWPGILMISALAFIFGSLVGGYILLLRGGSLKSTVPFGPFLALASATVFFFGGNILEWYFGLFRG